MSKMQIEKVKTDTLIPYAKNARTHSPEQVGQIAASIRSFGFNNPILVDGEKGIIAGHGRLLAAQKLGLDEVPVIELGHMTDTQKRAYIIADNKMAINAGWDDEFLRLELDDLAALDFDLELTGFSLDEIDALQPEIIAEGLTDEDAVPEPPAIPVTVEGDVWLLGRHRLMCGDSTSIDAVERLMGGQKADMVFTDPPYNVNYGAEKHPSRKQRSIQNDNMSQSDFKDFCSSFAACIKASCNGCVYVFGPPGPDGRVMFMELDNALHCSTTIVWKKDRFVMGRGKYHNQYEPCWFGWNDSGVAFINDRKLTNVWEYDRPNKSDLHPTMKPVALVENAIGHASNNGGTVLDLFGGSGTTVIASERLSRKCNMMELDPKYCDVIINRWQAFTGLEATHEETGKTYNEMNIGKTKA